MTLAYESLVAPLTPGERDRFCAEAAETAILFGVPADWLPVDRRGLDGYLTRMYASGEIAVGPDARALADALFSPPLGPATRLFRITRLVTTGLLPESVRAGYGLQWDARRERTFRAVMTFIRRARRLLPASLREWPVARNRSVRDGGCVRYVRSPGTRNELTLVNFSSSEEADKD